MIRRFKMADTDFGKWPLQRNPKLRTATMHKIEDEPNVISVFDLNTLDILRKIETPHTADITAQSTDRLHYIITGSDDCTACVFRTVTYERIGMLIGHKGGIVEIQITPDRKIYTSSKDKTIRRWDAETLVCEAIYEGHPACITNFEYGNISKRVYSGDECGNEICWDYDGTILAQINDHGCKITGIILLSSSTWISSSANPAPSTNMGMIIARDTRIFRTKCTWPIPAQVTCLSAGPDCSTFFFGTADGEICCVENLSAIYETCKKFGESVEMIFINEDGQKIIVGSGNAYLYGSLHNAIPIVLMQGLLETSVGTSWFSLLSNGHLNAEEGCLIVIGTNTKITLEETTFCISNLDNTIYLTVSTGEMLEKWKFGLCVLQHHLANFIPGVSREQILSRYLFDQFQHIWIDRTAQGGRWRIHGMNIPMDVVSIIKNYI